MTSVKKIKKNKDIVTFLQKKQLIKKKPSEKTSTSDLILGNVPLLKNTEEKISLKKKRQRDYKELQKEKKALQGLTPEERKEASHLLAIQKAIRKSEGEKICSESILKKSFKQKKKRKGYHQKISKKK